MLAWLFILLCLVFLYGYLNDRKLGRLPPEAALIFSPARLTPQEVRVTAEALSNGPVVMKNFLPPKTGRRYIIVGGVSRFSSLADFTAWPTLSPLGRISRRVDRSPTVGARREP